MCLKLGLRRDGRAADAPDPGLGYSTNKVYNMLFGLAKNMLY